MNKLSNRQTVALWLRDNYQPYKIYVQNNKRKHFLGLRWDFVRVTYKVNYEC